MRFAYTDEMNRLRAIYEPYQIGCELSPDAPKEAVEAKKEFFRLFHIECEKNSRIDLL